MRRIFIISVVSVFFLLFPVSCIGQAKVFESLAKMPDVTSVYIGKAAMRLGAGASFMSGEFAGANAIKKINSLEVISCEKKSAIPEVKKKADAIIAQFKMDVLVETNENNERVLIYGGTPEDGNEDYIDNLLIYEVSDNELNIVYIDGKINVKEFMNESGN